MASAITRAVLANFVLYRHDGLAVCNATPRNTVNINKEICRVFNQNGLRITIEANKHIINFLDDTFNLNTRTYKPFTKPNTALQCVHHRSNHPPITTKNITAGINKRLSSLSSDKTSFHQAAPPPIPKSTPRKRIPLHSTLQANHDFQTEKQTLEHPLVQPSI